jgi:hypothetical protein
VGSEESYPDEKKATKNFISDLYTRVIDNAVEEEMKVVKEEE